MNEYLINNTFLLSKSEVNNNCLYHYGVLHQRRGFRRWQNEDGSLTEAGRAHYGVGLPRKIKNARERGLQKAYSKASESKKKLDEAEKNVRENTKKLKKASNDYAVSTKRSEVAKYDFDKALKKHDKSFFGHPFEVGRTKKSLESATNKEAAAKKAFDNADNELSRAEVNRTNMRDLYNEHRNKADKKASKYIKKYSAASMKELMDSNEEFKKNVTNVESGQKYTYYDEDY